MGAPAPVQALESFFTTAEVASRYRTVAGTVRYWRHIGYGPRGTKVGRRFLYPETEIRRFDAQLLAKATATATGKNDDSAGAATPTPSVERINETASKQIGTRS